MKKIIMYHYVRNKIKEYPYSNHLSKKKFLAQLNFFLKNGGIVDKKDNFLNNNNKYLLTFDDGFKDHLYVAEKLKKIGAIGIFFIPMLPYVDKKILDVHKSHLILSKIKPRKALNYLEYYLNKYNSKNILNYLEKEKFKDVYKLQNDDIQAKKFKKIINYYSDLKIKSKILDEILKKENIKLKAKNFYLNKDELKYISDLGMIIGSHGMSHTVLTRLNYRKKKIEIQKSKELLEKIIKKKVDTFCFPYGGKNSYDKDTLSLLQKSGYKYSFRVKNQDFSKKLYRKKIFELPRYDCNRFIKANFVE